MEKIIVKETKGLTGEVDISTAKNSVLPIIAASILCPEKVILKNIKMLEDVQVITSLMRELNGEVEYSEITEDLILDSNKINPLENTNELVRKMRASFLVMGPMLARFGKCKISLPGGCNIGSRPIELHLKGFKALGANIKQGHGYIEASVKKFIGNRIYLDFPSVGATENIIMAAVLAKGTTVIENAADEPEIWDLVRFLNKMGASIYGAGARKIIIRGVDRLRGVIHRPIYDRIEAGTFMVAAAITNSMIKINDVNEEYLMPIIEKLKECGVVITEEENGIIVDGRYDKCGADIKTLPHPGFPTDMQPQMMTLLSTIKGTSMITETVFENRFMHVDELRRMGANIKIEGRTAYIKGSDRLTGCAVKSTDLRAGAALIIAGLVAEGETQVDGIYNIDRGYKNIEKKFRQLGAEIERINI
ncbi:UDP-N-acetylglucosamine 1-carboxyvinyltransferase [uncultured Clostridium sp.]|uniref:UDP-N-acetylglucosamine 1-carboxyvinyltransferase n=1 Tax=uncultured Clostridium sp. TaxID=59620 RepID=UPI00260A4AC2|nr:UDP-N-acetylglucosamine 1-carboxyvinyltransferase [uncultured Clostridium sp.]